MNRRLFIGQLTAGLALQSIPASLMADSLSSISPNLQSVSWFDEAAELIQSGSLGTPQRLTISRVYSPELTPSLTLRAMARQDFDLVGRLLRKNLSIDPDALFIDSPLSHFGSYSTCFHRDGMALTWQALARIGRQVTEPTRTLRIMGSQGVLQVATDRGNCQLVNLQGQLVKADYWPSSL